MAIITSRSELQFFIQADRIMNGLPLKISMANKLSWLLSKSWWGVKINYLECLRCYSYYKQARGFVNRIMRLYYGRKFRRLSLKLGYSIGEDVFGYGLVLPHYGTVVVGGTNRVGNFATIHTLTCIADCHSVIGDNLDLATGTVISKQVRVGDSVSSCANSSITDDIPSNSLVAGSPAKIVRMDYPSWHVRDGELFMKRVMIVEQLKQRLIPQ